MRKLLLAASLLTLGACSQQPGAPVDTPSDGTPSTDSTAMGAKDDMGASAEAGPNTLTPAGLGDIVVGKAPPATLKADAAPTSDSCRIYSDKARRIYAMTDGKVVARVTAMSGSKVRTAQGIGVGDSEAAVRKAYPGIAEQPHKYVEAPAKYLDWRPDGGKTGGGKTGLRFEIDKEGKVAMIHAGREPEIEYVEGCA